MNLRCNECGSLLKYYGTKNNEALYTCDCSPSCHKLEYWATNNDIITMIYKICNNGYRTNISIYKDKIVCSARRYGNIYCVEDDTIIDSLRKLIIELGLDDV
jgi:ssDNA-binding Zn-finger/Zn-ribbon topoisomerase 1